jgi:hypothetical protein
MPADAHPLDWAMSARALAGHGRVYPGKASPWWYDATQFHDRRADPGQGRRLSPGAEGPPRPRRRGRARALRAHLLRPRARRAAGVRCL